MKILFTSLIILSAQAVLANPVKLSCSLSVKGQKRTLTLQGNSKGPHFDVSGSAEGILVRFRYINGSRYFDVTQNYTTHSQSKSGSGKMSWPTGGLIGGLVGMKDESGKKLKVKCNTSDIVVVTVPRSAPKPPTVAAPTRVEPQKPAESSVVVISPSSQNSQVAPTPQVTVQATAPAETKIVLSSSPQPLPQAPINPKQDEPATNPEKSDVYIVSEIKLGNRTFQNGEATNDKIKYYDKPFCYVSGMKNDAGNYRIKRFFQTIFNKDVRIILENDQGKEVRIHCSGIEESKITINLIQEIIGVENIRFFDAENEEAEEKTEESNEVASSVIDDLDRDNYKPLFYNRFAPAGSQVTQE